jgi:cell division protein FtsB
MNNMEEKNYTLEDYVKLERHYNVLVGAVERLEKENKRVIERNEFLEASIINAQQALDIQKQVNINAITDMNKSKASYAEDLNRLQQDKKALQEEIRKLQDGN